MENLGLNSFYLHLPIVSMPHEDILNAIRIYGTEVVPKVKDYFSKKDNTKAINFK